MKKETRLAQDNPCYTINESGSYIVEKLTEVHELEKASDTRYVERVINRLLFCMDQLPCKS